MAAVSSDFRFFADRIAAHRRYLAVSRRNTGWSLEFRSRGWQLADASMPLRLSTGNAGVSPCASRAGLQQNSGLSNSSRGDKSGLNDLTGMSDIHQQQRAP